MIGNMAGNIINDERGVGGVCVHGVARVRRTDWGWGRYSWGEHVKMCVLFLSIRYMYADNRLGEVRQCTHVSPQGLQPCDRLCEQVYLILTKVTATRNFTLQDLK